MHFDVGLLDRLFGERVTIEVPTDNGGRKEVKVTRRWLEKMQRDGHAVNVDHKYVSMHVIGPGGYEKRVLEIGKDIPQDRCEALRDRTSSAIYALTVYHEGVPSTKVVPKGIWDQARAQMDAIDAAARSS